LLAWLALVASCSTENAASPPDGARFQAVGCPQPDIAGFPELDFPPGVQCGTLDVPEDHTRPDGRRIQIFVMRAPAVSATPRPDPIVYLSGGPGGAGSFEIASMIGHGINADREVIFVDQRGTHRATPRLGCPGWERFLYDAVSLPFTAASTTAEDAAAIQTCHDRLAATGADLADYNSTQNAADIAALRVALGIESWNVYGVSYGSNLALTLLRNHPQGIRSVVLDSVSPPSNNIAETWWQAPASSFKAIFAACAAQPSCAKHYPNLQETFTATVNHLDQTPVTWQVTPASGPPVTVNIDGFAFVYTLITQSEHGEASEIPKLIADMAHGYAQGVASAYLAARGPEAFIGLAGVGLAMGVFCAENADRTTEAAALATAKAALPGFPDRVLRIQPKQGRLFTDCPVWNVGVAPPSVSAPVVSEVPVLILEGAFDAATAPAWVDLVTPYLRNAQAVTFPFTGHSVLGKSTCARSIMADFLDHPAQPVDASCAAQITLTFSSPTPP
jgi:pimeloyl-ACP methyl ester carboxylesterase